MPSRGRPSINDSQTLRKVAMRLASGQARTARSAIAQALDNPSDTAIRRLQRKWRTAGDRYLAEARAHWNNQVRFIERELQAPQPSAFTSDLLAQIVGPSYSMGAFGDPIMQMKTAFGSVADQVELLRRTIEDSPAQKAIREATLQIGRYRQDLDRIRIAFPAFVPPR